MLTFTEVIINFLLIVLILLSIPQENVGLTNSAQHFLNFLIGIGVVIYFLIAIKLNLIQN